MMLLIILLGLAGFLMFQADSGRIAWLGGVIVVLAFYLALLALGLMLLL